MTKTKVLAHTGHSIEFTEDASIVCLTCEENVWTQDAVNAKGRKNSKDWYAKTKIEDPDRIRTINREKSRAHRARMKADPVKYAEYLAQAKIYNDRAIAKRKAASAK